jgi:hypothetical protein
VRNSLEAAGVLGIDHHILLHAHQANNLLALVEVLVSRLDNLCQAEAAHHVTQRNGRQVRIAFSHPDSHGGINGKEANLRQRLPVLQFGKLRFAQD